MCRPVRPGADVCQVPWAVRGLVPGTSYSVSGGECTDAGTVILPALRALTPPSQACNRSCLTDGTTALLMPVGSRRTLSNISPSATHASRRAGAGPPSGRSTSRGESVRHDVPVDAFRRYFEDNPEILAALVAGIAVAGGLVGSVIGGKIQANGGRDQAAAAREAAQIAAEAQRVAALWTVRQIQAAAFIRSVREARRLSEMFYKQNAVEDGLDVQLREARQDVAQKRAEIELVVPLAVLRAAGEVAETLDSMTAFAEIAGPGTYFTDDLNIQALSPNRSQSRLAGQALNALDALRAVDSSGRPDRFTDAMAAVRAATNATVQQAVSVTAYVLRPRFPSEVAENRERLNEKLALLIDAARAMLRSEDDIAPAVPPQRRRWRPAA